MSLLSRLAPSLARGYRHTAMGAANTLGIRSFHDTLRARLAADTAPASLAGI
ncbi:hypothetical protein J3B02_004939, partial [Coemansia erecta]